MAIDLAKERGARCLSLGLGLLDSFRLPPHERALLRRSSKGGPEAAEQSPLLDAQLLHLVHPLRENCSLPNVVLAAGVGEPAAQAWAKGDRNDGDVK